MSDDIVFSIGDKKCILDNEFKKALMELIKISNIDVEEQVKMAKTCLSIRYNLKSTIYTNKKILNLMLHEFFYVKVLYEVLIVPHHISQKKYYNKINTQSE